MSVRTPVATGRPPRSRAATTPSVDVGRTAGAAPPAIAVDLGSGRTQVWVAGSGTVGGPTSDTAGRLGRLVHRGRVVDGAGCIVLLSELVRRFKQPIAPRSVVAVCRPVQVTEAEQEAMRRVVTEVFAPSRVLFVDTVRAAAIGAGTAAGGLLIADIGFEVTEVALLDQGRVQAARRSDIGTRDLERGATPEHIARTTSRMIDDLRHDAAGLPALSAARSRGLVVVGDGAMKPDVTVQIAGQIRIPVRCAASPWGAALNGAGLAAMAVTRHPATS